jgi:hypothetical protein
MPQWQLKIALAVGFLLSVIPFALCLPLWKRLRLEDSGGWRGVVSRVGLGLATLASLVPPLWLVTMGLLAQVKDSQESAALGRMLDAVFLGMLLSVIAAIALCFARGRVRWMGLTACGVTVALFLLSFVVT